MAINNLYIITLWGGTQGAETRQDFAYRVNSEVTVANAAGLRATFVANVLNRIADCVSVDMQFTRLVTKNLYNIADWEEHDTVPVVFGNRAGQALVLFAAAAFKSQKPTSQQPPARKRFGYLSESDVQGGGLQNVLGYFAALNTLATWLGSTIADPDGNTYEPTIVKRIGYVTPSGSVAYRYPEHAAEAITFPAINWSWDNVVTSQVSRKFGRGI